MNANPQAYNSSIFSSLRVYLFAVALIWYGNAHCPLRGQTHPHFNVNLLLNYRSAEQSIALYKDQPVSTQALSELRGNVVAAATARLIDNRSSASSLLREYLDSLKYHQIIKDDIFHLEEARSSAPAIGELLDQLQKRNFNRKIIATVEQIFPEDAAIDIAIPVYVVAFGHEHVDAFVRRIVWHGDVPIFVGETEGELTIIVNLAHAVSYGRDLNERIVSLLGVVAHEVFHAAFGAYKDNSPEWKAFYSRHRQPIDQLLDLTQNEGIAYYLSLEEQGHGQVPSGWFEHTREIFDAFNKNSSELLSRELSPHRAAELLRKANLSGYWESYGSMAGMVIAREIDLRLGRAALIATIATGPYEFFRTYLTLTGRDTNIPRLGGALAEMLQKSR